MGVLFVFQGIVGIYRQDEIEFLHWFQLIFGGAVLFVIVFGIFFERKTGRSHLAISNRAITLKTQWYQKARVFPVEDIAAIHLELTRIVIVLRDQERVEMLTSAFSYVVGRQIKQSLSAFAAENQIDMQQ